MRYLNITESNCRHCNRDFYDSDILSLNLYFIVTIIFSHGILDKPEGVLDLIIQNLTFPFYCAGPNVIPVGFFLKSYQLSTA